MKSPNPATVKEVKYDFPKKLDDRIEAILSSVNTEFKQVTLLAGLKEYPQTGESIYNNVKKSVNGAAYVPCEGSMSSYCRITLVPIGLVAEETITKDIGNILGSHKTMWNLTKEGIKYGLPIAAFSMDYALKNGKSLYEILGSVHSKGERKAVFSKIGILKELSKNDSLQQAELASKLNLNAASINNYLKSLAKAGFISNDSTLDSFGKVTYVATGKENKNIEKIYDLSIDTATKVVDVIKNSDVPLNRYDIADKVKLCHGNLDKILIGLRRQGFIKPDKWANGKYSEVKILDSGIKFIENYVTPITKALQDNNRTLDDMQQIMQNMNYNTYSTALNMYASISTNVNKRTAKERKVEILEIIKNNPGINSREICDKMPIDVMVIRKYLSQLTRQNCIIKNRIKGNSTYKYHISKM